VQPLRRLHHHEPERTIRGVAYGPSSSSIGLPHPRRGAGQWCVLPATAQRRWGLEGAALHRWGLEGAA